MSPRRARRALAAVLALVAAAAGLAATATGANSQLHLTEAKGTGFPNRTWILGLPAGQRIQPSQVSVSENGHGVVGLKVEPSGAPGKKGSGTILIVDASESMKGQPIASALAAAKVFAARRNTNQSIGVVTFNASTNTVQSPTESQTAINTALSKHPQVAYGTHLYDAVAQAVQLLRAAGITVGSIVVLSDGADTGSKVSLDQVTQSAKDAGVRVFTIAFRSTTNRPTALQKLSLDTGGTFSRAATPSDLAPTYDALGLQLAHEYVVSYNSTSKTGVPVRVAMSVAGVGKTTAAYTSPPLVTGDAVYHPSAQDKIWTSTGTMIAVGLLIPLLVAMAIIIPIRRRNSTVRARVSDYVSMPSRRKEADALVSRVFVGTERSLERTRWWQRFKDAVAFADVPFPPIQIVFGIVILTLLAMWLLWLIDPILALAGLVVPVIIRSIIVGRIAKKRRVFADQLADNLDVLASGLRAGHSLVGAFAVVVNDAPEPSRTEFQRVVADEQLGISLEDALGGVATRMKNRDIEQVALVASVQSETGGNAAEVLDRVTESIRERQELRRLVRILTAQGRLARWIVSLLPVGLLILITLISHNYMKPLFTHTSGLIMLTVATIMIIVGSIVIGRIVDIEV
jgi:tight adherence protein B